MRVKETQMKNDGGINEEIKRGRSFQNIHHKAINVIEFNEQNLIVKKANNHKFPKNGELHLKKVKQTPICSKRTVQMVNPDQQCPHLSMILRANSRK